MVQGRADCGSVAGIVEAVRKRSVALRVLRRDFTGNETHCVSVHWYKDSESGQNHQWLEAAPAVVHLPRGCRSWRWRVQSFWSAAVQTVQKDGGGRGWKVHVYPARGE